MTEIVKLAKEAGFNAEYTVPVEGGKIYFLWLCELQYWLLEEHRIIISINSWLEDGVNVFEGTIIYDWCEEETDDGLSFATYSGALEHSLLDALKILKDKPNE